MTAERPIRILLFNSGMGGLTVARAVAHEMPEADLIYAADTAAFPYGAWEEAPLIARIIAVIGTLLDKIRPDVTVIACNTASTLAIWHLRERYPEMPFVGTVPAIKPAATATRSGIIGVLATPGTVRREYTRALIDTYASHCTVILHGSEHLAALAEAKLDGTKPSLKAIAQEIRPVFKKRQGKHTDTVVLGCTHYPLLLEELNEAAPWPVTFIDPAPAIARRVAHVSAEYVSAERPLVHPAPSGLTAGTVLFTSAPFETEMLEAYARFGFTRHDVVPMPR